jgi:ABC-type Fe3+-citrate transport system substrate-binding protein
MRSENEKETLEYFSIDRDLTAERGGEVSRLGDQVRQLYDTIDEKTDSEAVDSADAVLEAVGRLDFGQTSVGLEAQIKNFKENLDDLGDIQSPVDQKREFRSRLEQQEKEIRELHDEINTASIGRLNFRLNEQKYKRYHARAKQQLGEESDTAVVRLGYQRYLEQQAESNGW